MKPAHRRHIQQRAWIIFAGRADHAWQRWLRPGFRHCFAAIEDAQGWMVLEALTGRLLLARLDVPSGFDAPAFYRRAGMVPVGPFPLDDTTLGPVRGPLPLNCVSVCRAVLGPHAPFAWTPYGLYRALSSRDQNRKKYLTNDISAR
ncbi:hypothetical protein [Roseococcus microcysteis]|uniref:hypothetical protein n=1 Tax=Roseococcus microcysteis TaxID=2771361 RepID=UPI00168ACE63|nr:hypothetical protein [Roseococcus microcysteis]